MIVFIASYIDWEDWYIINVFNDDWDAWFACWEDYNKRLKTIREYCPTKSNIDKSCRKVEITNINNYEVTRWKIK